MLSLLFICCFDYMAIKLTSMTPQNAVGGDGSCKNLGQIVQIVLKISSIVHTQWVIFRLCLPGENHVPGKPSAPRDL